MHEHRYFEMDTVDAVIEMASADGRQATVTGSGATYTWRNATYWAPADA